jgi:tetratricopeptide (TPR) repeat protein
LIYEETTLDRENLSELNTIWDEARNHIESGHQDKAIEIYKYILVRYNSDPVATEYANAYLGDIFLSLHQLDLAEEHIKKAISSRPDKADYHYILGFVFTYRRQWAKAISESKIAVSQEPNNGEFIRGLGWATFQNGDRTRGLSLLQKANRLAPDNVSILTDLAVAYMGTNLRTAKQYAEQAAAIEPGSKLVQDVLSKIRIFEENMSQMLDGARLSWPGDLNVKSSALEIFQFKVSIRDNPNTWCIIEIKENQLLSTFHKGIAKAFDYSEERSYSFFFHQSKDNKQNEFAAMIPGISETAKLAKSIRIDSIFLFKDEGQKFHYLYDYGKKVLHEVELVKIIEKVPRAVYPRVVKKHGKLP